MNRHFNSRRLVLSSLAMAFISLGCIDAKMMENQNPPPKEPAAAPNVAAPAPQANAAPAANPLPQDNTKLVDLKQAMADNPALIITENRINAGDPVSAAAQGYFAISSQANLLNLKHQVDIMKAINDGRTPSFAEFSDLLRQANVQLKGLYRWQVYAYDESTGEIVILEDHEYKKREYEKGGLKLD
ncbi:hypothetical protein SH668x_003288 [Planctomicrobium sp. SH668]|uniref:hypothetical protein n=1 Tax=Planctomicrobium sp. SH668 TaxID=3448126 RepID=UPI003F5BBEFB